MQWGKYMNEEWQGLKSLSETCRRLHTIAQPILFHSLRPRSDQNAFIRLIASRPDLGNWTRQISFNPYDYDDEDDEHFQEQLAKRLHLTSPGQSFRGRHSKLNDVQFSLKLEILLSLLTNVEDCRLPALYSFEADADDADYVVFPHFSQRVNCLNPRPVLPSLKALTMEYLPIDGQGLQPLVTLLKAAPNLHRLRISTTQPGPMHALDNLSGEVLQKINVKVLDFYPSEDDILVEDNIGPAIQNLAKLFQQLEEFNFYPRSACTYDYRYSVFSPAEVILSLSSDSTTLKRMEIDTSDYSMPTTHTNLGPALATLTNLVTLSMDAQCFCHHGPYPESITQDHDVSCITSILPNTVEYLSIKLRKDRKSINDIVELGAQVAAGKFSNLNRVDVVHGNYALYSVEISEVKRGLILAAFSNTQTNAYFRYTGKDTPRD